MKDRIKYDIAHFPVGTVVEISIHGETFERTVSRLVIQRAYSFCLYTGVQTEHCGEEGYNADHVKRIIKRGDGPVLVTSLIDKDSWVKSFVRQCPARKSKSEYASYYDSKTMLTAICIVNGILKPGMYVDWSRLATAAQSLGVVRPHGMEYHIYVANKKRVRRWLRQNINRFLFDYQAVRKFHLDEDEAMYLSDLEDDEKNYVEVPLDVEGSSYDGTDYSYF